MELTTIFRLNEELRRLGETAARTSERLKTPATTSLSGMPRRATRSTDRLERLTAKLLDVRQAIARKREEIEAAQVELAEEIDERVPDEFGSTVLILRYVTCLTWSEVSARLDYPRRELFRERSAWEEQFNSYEEETL